MKRHFTSPGVILAVLLIGSLTVASTARGQATDLEELKAMMKEMQATIAKQNTLIEEQNKRIATLESRQQQQQQKQQQLSASVQQAAAASKGALAGAVVPTSGGRTITLLGGEVPVGDLPSSAIPQGHSLVRDMDNFVEQQTAAPRANNIPIDPELKGFIPIPGTDTIFKIGGSARIDVISDFGNNGNPNQFVPSTIPVLGEEGHDGGFRSTLHTKATRMNLELRRPLPGDDNNLRIFSEFDFFDDSTSSAMKFRARHFYGQAWNLLIGQTYSAFMDIDAFPDLVDYQGPNGIVNRRLPQIRYTHPVWDRDDSKFLLFGSVEQPELRIDTETDEFSEESSTVTRIPDVVLGTRFEGEQGHLQASTLLRELSFESDRGPDKEAFGWGVSLSGALNVGAKDKLSAQVTYGEGIARYINDLSGEDLDAALDGSNLNAIPVLAATVGYTHHWNEHWRSTIAGGYVDVDTPGVLDEFAIDSTLYGSVNLMWHPTSSFRMGFEYLHGDKETLGGEQRDAHRVNFVLRYDLVR